jgi:hypothetical protein
MCEEVDLRSITDVRLETSGTSPSNHILHISHQAATPGGTSEFGIRYESMEQATATANSIQAALVGV